MVLKVVIIGAGLGGLAAAVSLKFEDPSHSVLILESAASLTEVRPRPLSLEINAHISPPRSVPASN